ncbi:MAG: Imm50 family immunity protein [Cellulosilyticaceae bacterium]
MYEWFDNGFVINNIFENQDIFIGSEVDNINYRPLSGIVTMEILTKCDVIKPPKKWKKWDFVTINIELAGIEEFNAKTNSGKIVIEEISLDKSKEQYILGITGKDKSNISCKFVIGRIHNLIPMIYKPEWERYESALI